MTIYSLDVLLFLFGTSLLFHVQFTCVYAKSLQSCPTLCDPRDGSPPGSSVPTILQARTLEWVAISFSNAWKWKGNVCIHIHVCIHIRVCVCVCVCVYKPHLLYLFLCWWIFRLFKVWEILDPVPALWWPTLSVLRRLWIQAGFPSPKNFHHSIPYRLPHLLPALNWCPCYWVGISLLGRVSEMWPSSSTVHQETRRLLYLPCGEKIDHSTDYDHL